MTPAAQKLKKSQAKAKREKFQIMLMGQIMERGLPKPQTEYRFHPERRWRLDFAWPELFILVEVDGGVYTNGRHTRGKGYEQDAIKLAEAASMGYLTFRFSTGQVSKGIAIHYIEKTIRGRIDD